MNFTKKNIEYVTTLKLQDENRCWDHYLAQWSFRDAVVNALLAT